MVNHRVGTIRISDMLKTHLLLKNLSYLSQRLALLFAFDKKEALRLKQSLHFFQRVESGFELRQTPIARY